MASLLKQLRLTGYRRGIFLVLYLLMPALAFAQSTFVKSPLAGENHFWPEKPALVSVRKASSLERKDLSELAKQYEGQACISAAEVADYEKLEGASLDFWIRAGSFPLGYEVLKVHRDFRNGFKRQLFWTLRHNLKGSYFMVIDHDRETGFAMWCKIR